MNRFKNAVTILLVVCFILSNWLAIAYSVETLHEHHHDEGDAECAVCQTLEGYLQSAKKLFTTDTSVIVLVLVSFLVITVTYIWSYSPNFPTLVGLKVKLSD